MSEIIIYADENVDLAIVEALNRRGISAYSCKDFQSFGITDEQQIQFAFVKSFVILTHDPDFLRMVSAKKVKHSGILFVAQGKFSVGELLRRIESIVSVLNANDMKNHIEFL